MHKLLILLLPLALTACIDDVAKVGYAVHKSNQEAKDHPENGIRYARDVRTNLCFIIINGNMDKVDCTPEILAEVEKADKAKVTQMSK